MKLYDRPGKIKTIMIEPLAESPFLLSCYAPENTIQDSSPTNQNLQQNKTIHEKMLEKLKATLTELGVCEVLEKFQNGSGNQKMNGNGRPATPPSGLGALLGKNKNGSESNLRLRGSFLNAVTSTSESLLDSGCQTMQRIEHIDIEEWTPQDVRRWLEYLDDEEILTSKTFLLDNGERIVSVKAENEAWIRKPEITDLFSSNDICGETLLELNTKDLQDLGICTGQTNYLMNEIARIKKRRGLLSFFFFFF